MGSIVHLYNAGTVTVHPQNSILGDKASVDPIQRGIGSQQDIQLRIQSQSQNNFLESQLSIEYFFLHKAGRYLQDRSEARGKDQGKSGQEDTHDTRMIQVEHILPYHRVVCS